MKLILNMEVENWDTFNKVYILGDNSNRENAGIKKSLQDMRKINQQKFMLFLIYLTQMLCVNTWIIQRLKKWHKNLELNLKLYLE